MHEGTASLRADAQRNYNRLLQAAEKVFLKNGSATTLESIAKQAGVGIGTLYRHFPTRKSLLEAVYAPKITALIDKVPALLQKTTPEEALARWLQLLVDYSVRFGGFSNVIALSLQDSRSPLIAAGAKMLTNAQRAGTVRSDITIIELLRLITNIISEGAPKETEKLLSIVVAGLKQ